MPCRIESTAEPRSTTAEAPRPLPEALAWIEDEMLAIRSAGLERPHRRREGRQGAEVRLDGRTLLNFGSNDYLGYAGDVRLTRAASKGSCAEGFGAGASPLVSGHSRAHEALERAIARFLGVEAALVFPSGFAANTATIAALVGPDDFIASDSLNHASIIDGCRLARARVGVYPHRDLIALSALLDSARGARRRLIVTDTLFSMDGTIAPLAGLCDVARTRRAMVLVDEAHATGVFGDRGSGLVEQTGTADGVHVRVGTLSKALGAAGGFVAGGERLIQWLRHTARAWIFSTAHPPGVAAAATRAIGLVEQEPDRRVGLRGRADDFASRLRRAGLDIGGTESQIVPIIAGEPAAAVALSEQLAAAGFFVPAIRPPSVPRGRSLVRASLSWLHDEPDLRRLAAALAAHAR
ncbi:MAG: 8-amino-7-oxononanoate synthase [Planctomycetia bacterium]|nr:8-amino-7-oxononanoate synthase [Planctomycetia bacterium]